MVANRHQSTSRKYPRSTTPIRWADIPHTLIQVQIENRLGRNAQERSAEDSARYILRRRLPLLSPEDHRRFIELEACGIVERLRSTRDEYRLYVTENHCKPISDAYWVVFRLAVVPAAIEALREKFTGYLKSTDVPGVALLVLYGRVSSPQLVPIVPLDALDLGDKTPAAEEQLRALERRIDDDAVRSVHPDGPFTAYDLQAARSSFHLVVDGMTLPEWCVRRKQLWNMYRPWTEGLATLFECVKDELRSQFQALSIEALLRPFPWEPLSPIEEIVLQHYHDMRTAAEGRSFGDEKWRHMLAELDSRCITLDENLPEAAKKVLSKAREKRPSIKTWVEAYNFRVSVILPIANGKKTYTLRREITHHLHNVARSAEAKLSLS